MRTEKKTSKIIIINSIRNSKQVSGGSCPVSRLRKKFYSWVVCRGLMIRILRSRTQDGGKKSKMILVSLDCVQTKNIKKGKNGAKNKNKDIQRQINNYFQIEKEKKNIFWGKVVWSISSCWKWRKTIRATTFRPMLRGHLRAAMETVACVHCKGKKTGKIRFFCFSRIKRLQAISHTR